MRRLGTSVAPNWDTLRMSFVAYRMEWQYPRCCKESLRQLFRYLCVLGLLVLLSVALYPGLWSIGVRLYAVSTGSYVAGHHSVLLINSPNEQVARDIGRAIMERQMAASINILPSASSMYYWKGEVRDAAEIVMLVKTKTSMIQKVIDYVRSIHPYENPDILSLAVGFATASHMRWMDEAVPDD